MAKGNVIIVSSEPRGVFEGCIVSGALKPGTVVEIQMGTALKNGRWTYEAAGLTAANSTYSGMSASGDRLPIAVLLDDWEQGKLPTDAYVSGTRGKVYYPAHGEELNMILKDVAGTGANQDFVPGTKLIVDDGTGKLLASAGTPESEPFLCLETVTDLAADTLTWCKFTGF